MVNILARRAAIQVDKLYCIMKYIDQYRPISTGRSQSILVNLGRSRLISWSISVNPSRSRSIPVNLSRSRSIPADLIVDLYRSWSIYFVRRGGGGGTCIRPTKSQIKEYYALITNE